MIGDIFGFRRGLKLEDARRESIRLNIQEQRLTGSIEKLNREREALFRQGQKEKTPSKRRILARQFEEKSTRIKITERELVLVSKAATVMSRVRSAMERRGPRGGLLEGLNEKQIFQIEALIQDANIKDELFDAKLNDVLGIITETEAVTAELGEEGSDVLKTWEKLDEGELGFEEGLKEAIGKQKETERKGEEETA
jgi:hypothetical protein